MELLDNLAKNIYTCMNKSLIQVSSKRRKKSPVIIRPASVECCTIGFGEKQVSHLHIICFLSVSKNQ